MLKWIRFIKADGIFREGDLAARTGGAADILVRRGVAQHCEPPTDQRVLDHGYLFGNDPSLHPATRLGSMTAADCHAGAHSAIGHNANHTTDDDDAPPNRVFTEVRAASHDADR